MPDGDVIKVRCSPGNREVLERGIHVTGIQLALGEDGIYEMHFQSDRPLPLPDQFDHPLVPLKKGEGHGD